MKILVLRNVAYRTDLCENVEADVSESEGADLIRRKLAVAVDVPVKLKAVPPPVAEFAASPEPAIDAETESDERPQYVPRKRK